MHFSFVTIALTIAATAAPALAVPVRLLNFPQGPGLQAAPTAPHIGKGQPMDFNHLKYDAIHGKSRRASTSFVGQPVLTDGPSKYRSPGIIPDWLREQWSHQSNAARRELSPELNYLLEHWKGLPSTTVGNGVQTKSARRAASPIFDTTLSDGVDSYHNSPPLIGSTSSSGWRSPPFTRPRIGTTVLKNSGTAASGQNGYAPVANANQRRDFPVIGSVKPFKPVKGGPRIGTVILPKDDAPVRRDDYAEFLMKRLLADALEAL